MPEIGQTISHYRITEKLGAGGMGEVYKAHDITLDRMVAIKFLPEIFSADQERLRRFELEARHAASLSHSNVVGIHEFGAADGLYFAVMELVEGQTLRTALQHGPLPERRLLDIAVQVADGLAAAHAAGIVHRDLKPENIMITPDVRAKILDFGLAKQADHTRETGQNATLDTVTQPGTLLGTCAYMSPEQARGEPINFHSDIFSFGLVLYEMASGRNPFQRDSIPETLSAIIREEVPPLEPRVSAPLRWTIERCLAKDANERYESTRDLHRELRCLRAHISETRLEAISAVSAERGPGTSLHRGQRRALLWAAVIFCVGLVTGGWWAFVLNSVASGPSLTDIMQLTKEGGIETGPCLSPDGKSFIFAAQRAGRWDIFLQRIGGRNVTNLTKDLEGDSQQPAYSPDGERIAFRSTANGGGIFVMGATGESVHRVSAEGAQPAWFPDGKSLVASTDSSATPLKRGYGSKLLVITEATRQTRVLDPGDAIEPSVSPNGYRIAYWGLQKGGQRDLWTIPVNGGQPIAVTDDAALDWHPVWSPDGQFLYFCSDRGGTMNVWRIQIDEQSGKVKGSPQPVGTPSNYTGTFSISADGKSIAYEQVHETANIEKVAFDPVSAQFAGQPVSVTSGSYSFFAPSVSPDGTWLAADDLGRQEDLILMRPDGNGLLQLTDDSAKNRSPAWSPDGSQIAFHSDRGGRYDIWSIMADGSSLRQLTSSTLQGVRNPTWSPDGDWIGYGTSGFKSCIVQVSKRSTAQMPGEIEGINVLDWSPDARTLAGFWDSSHIAVYSFETGELRKLDVESAVYPKWLPDSRRLLIARGPELLVLDAQTALIKRVGSVAPGSFGLRLSMPQDGRMLYFTRQVRDSDIWCARLQ